jgi:group II intron reverse transcriptase/maturase
VRLVTPESIRTLQKKLYRKAKQEPGFRFYALYDKVYRLDILEHAYELARANGGAPGVDGVSFVQIEARQGKAALVEELAQSLQHKTYRAQAVRRVRIPKADGGERPLGIPTIRERVVQTAVKLVIEPIFEADFCEHSYGFRPQRDAHQAIDVVVQALMRGQTRVIDADLSKYFDSIPHAKLLRAVAQRIADGALLHLIKLWLKAPVVAEDGGSGGGKGKRRGTPQGGVISPLLANVYLHLLDRVWERHDMQRRYGATLVRYADDFVVLCAKHSEAAMRLIEQVLERLSLTLNTAKTQLVNAREQRFNFLGFAIGMRRSRRSGKLYAHVQPADKALKKIKARVTGLTARCNNPLPTELLVQQLNRELRGWVGYFHYRNCSTTLVRLKWHVEERLRTHLRKRHRVPTRAAAFRRFGSRALYEHYRLYKLPTTAGWSAAHASR